MTWTSQACSVAVARVAQELTIRLARRGLALCPSCGGAECTKLFAARTDGTDRWKCHRCDAGGDVVDLAAHVLTGSKCSRDNSAEVRAWFASRGWCDPDPNAGEVEVRARPTTAPAGQSTRSERPPPPRAEVRALIRSCRPPAEVPPVGAWLRARLGRYACLLPSGLVGALPDGVALPRWARFRGRSWLDLSYRAVIPVYDASGALASVRARCVGTAPDKAPKALPPTGHGLVGLVMANGTGRRLLLEGPTFAGPVRVVVAEGEPAFLTWCIKHYRSPVFGVVSGSWSEAVAARVPDGAEVLVATDHDDKGDAYAARITSTLANRCQVTRWIPRAHVTTS